MPRKIRELEEDLRHAGFAMKIGKGSHRKWTHGKYKGSITMSGSSGDDAKPYQERLVQKAIEESKGA
jgi:predicted RNA binding protein YcfA (HicA-like mRNA interferase family)